jgi:hypothetical protein
MDRISILQIQFVRSETAILLCLRRRREIARFIIASARVKTPQEGFCLDRSYWSREDFSSGLFRLATNFRASMCNSAKSRSESLRPRIAHDRDRRMTASPQSLNATPMSTPSPPRGIRILSPPRFRALPTPRLQPANPFWRANCSRRDATCVRHVAVLGE